MQTLKLKPASKRTLQLNKIPLVSVNTIWPSNPNGKGFIRDKAFEFSVGETHNLFVQLSDLEKDLDIYLGSTYDLKPIDDTAKFIYPYINSTQYGNNEETIFAQISKGTYYLVVRDNTYPYSTKELSGKLTFNSKIFDTKLSFLPNDPLLAKQWHLFNKGSYGLSSSNLLSELQGNKESNGILPNADIRAPEAWKKKYSASSVVVAVVDKGIEIRHPDLANNIWTNKDEIPGNQDDDDNNGKDDDINGWNFGNNTNDPSPLRPTSAHGTHVAGTIGATGNNGTGVTGVAWDVQIMPVSIENPYSGITNADKGLIYAIENGADIVNMSFGSNVKYNPADAMTYMTSDGNILNDAPKAFRKTATAAIEIFKKAKEADTLMVIAAGNDGSRSTKIAKWTQIGDLDNTLSLYNFLGNFYSNAVTVGSTDGMSQLSPYTNTGLTVDLTAPGGNDSSGQEYSILSTYPLGSKKHALQNFNRQVIDEGSDSADKSTWSEFLLKHYDTYIEPKYVLQDGADYGYMQGTSMAAPVTSGAAALVKAVNPNFSAKDIRQILLKSATLNNRLKGLAGQNGLQINLENALTYAEKWRGKQDFYDLETGSKNDDVLSSSPANTWIKGLAGNDLIRGNKGDDLLKGGAGDDELIPGEGLDKVIGGSGRDIIRYYHEDESPIARPDRITMTTDDQIDLSALDGNLNKPGLQKLKLIDTTQFTGQPGELLAKANGIFVDLNGDSFADFGTLFSKQLSFNLTSEHFIL